MPKIKKTKAVEPVVEPMVEVEPAVEPVVEEEPVTKKALIELYAKSKAQNPELYAAKNKDAQLAIKLSKL